MPSDAGSIPAASTNKIKGLGKGANPFRFPGVQRALICNQQMAGVSVAEHFTSGEFYGPCRH